MKTFLIAILFFSNYIFAVPSAIIENIHINQFGYRCGDQKIAIISSAQQGFYGSSFSPNISANNYKIKRWSDDVTVFQGTLTIWNSGATQTQSGDKVWWFNFSAFNTPGSYYVWDSANAKASYQFEINDQIYLNALQQCAHSYYYQRCGVSKTLPYVSAGYTDAACHIGALQDTDCRLYNNTNSITSKNLSGGWHDAGDYNKYVNFALSAVIDLCFAFQQNSIIWKDNTNLPESGNNQPDILDELKYEMDWLLKMQQTNGSVLSVVGVQNFASASPPSADLAQRLYGPATTSASYSAAAMFALVAIQFNAVGNTSYASTLQTAAINAYNWAQSNPNITFYNSGIIAAGEQEVSGYELDWRKMCANIFLYKLTGLTAYKSYVETNYTNMHLQQWGYVYPFENSIQDALLYYTTLSGVTPAVKNTILNNYTSSVSTNNGDNLPAYLNSTDAYRAYLSNQNYTTGSNNTKAHQGLIFTNMKVFNLDTINSLNYKNAASGYLHYLMGVNPTGFCFITNMGAFGAEKSIPEFYHSWFVDGSPLYDRVGVSTYGPPPGFVPAGVNPTYSLDGCCPSGCSPNNALCNSALVTPPLGQPIQKTYKDFNTSWPQNSWNVSETGIYFEASVLRLISNFVSSATNLEIILNPNPLHIHDNMALTSNVVGTSYEWRNPLNNIISTSASYIKNNISQNVDSGIYKLSLIESSTGCLLTDTIRIDVHGVYISAKAFLNGPYISASIKMHDSIRTKGLLPLTEPYTTGTGMQTAFTHINGGGGETTSNAILNITGDSAVVDWVFLEFRDPVTPTIIKATKSALILRNGTIVDAVNGSTQLNFRELIPGNYNMSIKHRNHFGIQSEVPTYFTDSTLFIDWTSNTISPYIAVVPLNTNLAYKQVGAVRTMWAGDINKDKKLRYNGISNDRLQILAALGSNANITLTGYYKEDINLDGKVRYNGISNDRLILLQSIGSTNGVLNEQISN